MPVPQPAPGWSGDGGGLHVAIIMDGNGRWAQLRGVPRGGGHRAGMASVRRVVEAAPDHGIGTLTLYAFSADNWRRPAAEVDHLMWLFRRYLRSEVDRMVEQGVRLRVIGRRDRLGAKLVELVERVEWRTRGGRRLTLQLAIDYSARDAILAAARAVATGADLDRDSFGALVSRALHLDVAMPPVDLLVRTGGEQRLSDFLLWESAYAELHFCPCLWPDFGAADLDEALRDFRRRERRYGGIPQSKEG